MGATERRHFENSEGCWFIGMLFKKRQARGVVRSSVACQKSIVVMTPASDDVKVGIIYRVHQPVHIINAP